MELERNGLRISLFALHRERDELVHPDAVELVGRLNAPSPLSSEVLRAQAYWLRRSPRRYVRAWWRALRGNIRSPAFLVRGLAVVPLAAFIARRAAEEDLDHLHAHWATHSALAAYLAADLCRLPWSLTAHAHDIYVDRTMLGEKLAAASFVATVSEYNRDLLTRLYGRPVAEKTIVVRCGVDLAVFRPQPRRPRPGDGPVRVLCVASLQPYKGHRYLIEACALLHERGVPLECTLVGDGELRTELEGQVATAGLADVVRFAGRRASEDVRDLLAGSDLFVLPSTTTETGKMEGVPVALMEAMAMELPCVCSRLSGIPELVEDGVTGTLVAERDAVGLAQAIEELVADPRRRNAMGRAGRRVVEERFTLQRNGEILRSLFERAAARDSG